MVVTAFHFCVYSKMNATFSVKTTFSRKCTANVQHHKTLKRTAVCLAGRKSTTPSMADSQLGTKRMWNCFVGVTIFIAACLASALGKEEHTDSALYSISS